MNYSTVFYKIIRNYEINVYSHYYMYATCHEQRVHVHNMREDNTINLLLICIHIATNGV